MKKFAMLYGRITRLLRKRIEHRRFQTLTRIVFVGAIGIIAFLPKTAEVLAQTSTFATEEVVLTTKKTSRLPVIGRVSQGFHAHHSGIDIEQPVGAPIFPFLGGVIFETGSHEGGYGNYVLIDHQNGYFSLYAHLHKILVKKEEQVSAEAVIGTVGLTGFTTGGHLHLEIYENNIAVNPLAVLPELPISSASARLVSGRESVPGRKLVLPIGTQNLRHASASAHSATSEASATKEKNATKALRSFLASELTELGHQPVR